MGVSFIVYSSKEVSKFCFVWLFFFVFVFVCIEITSHIGSDDLYM
jgi:TRAP-type C4-dicarboxylate transport system permease small subunit